MNVDEMLGRITGHQFFEWMWYEEFEPFEEHRGDIRTAQLATQLANIFRDRKARPQPFKLKDFLLILDADAKGSDSKVNVTNLKALAIAMTAAYNATEKAK